MRQLFQSLDIPLAGTITGVLLCLVFLLGRRAWKGARSVLKQPESRALGRALFLRLIDVYLPREADAKSPSVPFEQRTQSEFGSYLCELRQNRRCTQMDVANHLGLSVQTISRIERGVAVLKPQHHEALCKFFQLSDTQVVKFMSLAQKQKS